MYVVLSISSNKKFTVLVLGVASISKSIRGVVWCERLKTPALLGRPMLTDGCKLLIIKKLTN